MKRILLFAALATVLQSVSAGTDTAQTNVRSNPVTGGTQSFTWAFLGTDDANWATLNNWKGFNSTSGTWTETCTVEKNDGTKGYPQQPDTKNDDAWQPILIDGDLIVNPDHRTITLSDNFEGWSVKLALLNCVTVNVSTIRKHNGGGDSRFIWVDETSKLTFNTANSDGNCGGTTSFYIAAPEGVKFTSFNPQDSANFHYYFKGKGSMVYGSALNKQNHFVKQCELLMESTTKKVTSRVLVSYTSTDKTFDLNSVTVTSSNPEVMPIQKTSMPTTDDLVGTYYLEQQNTGVYLHYVEGTPATTVTGNIIAANAVWSTGAGLNLSGSIGSAEFVILTNTVENATLTFDANVNLGRIQIVNETGKSLTLAANDGTTVNVGAYDFSESDGNITVNFSTGSSEILAGKDTVLTKPGTGSVSIASGAKVTLSGDAYSWDKANFSGAGTLAVEAATGDTEVDGWGNCLVTGTYQILRGTWTLNGTSYQSTRAEMLFTGADAALKINKQDATGWSTTTGLTLEDGARLEVYKRDTFSRGLTLRNGAKLLMNDDILDSGRAFDFYSNSSLNVEGSTASIIGGITDETSTTGSGIIALRRNNFTITTDTESTLKVYSQMNKQNDGSGSLKKAGFGTVEFYRPAASGSLPLEIVQGRVRYIDDGSATTSSITISAGELELQANTKDITVTGEISGAGKIVKKGSHSATITAANNYTGEIDVNVGTLSMSGGCTAEGANTVSVAENTTLNITLNEGESRTFLANGSGTIVKNGAGILTIAALSDVAHIQLNAGILAIAGAATNTVSGSGTIRAVNAACLEEITLSGEGPFTLQLPVTEMKPQTITLKGTVTSVEFYNESGEVVEGDMIASVNDTTITISANIQYPDSLSYKNPVTGDGITFVNAFLGRLNATWSADYPANFAYLNNGTWGLREKTPYVSGGIFNATVVDGDIISQCGVVTATSGKYEITANYIEGWEAKFGFFHNVKVTMDICKFQGGTGTKWVMIDETSKLNISFNSVDGNTYDLTSWYIASPDGLEISNPPNKNLEGSWEYYFGSHGSAIFGANLKKNNQSHAIKRVDLDVGAPGPGVHKGLITRKIISKAADGVTLPTFTIDNDTIVVMVNGVQQTPFGTRTVSGAKPVGTYKVAQEEDGVYIYYVGYSADAVRPAPLTIRFR